MNSYTPHNKLSILIRNRERIIYDGDAKAITSYNINGLFDILPEHSNFISIIKDKIIIHKLDGTKQEYKIRTGVLKVNNNQVSIYLGILTQSANV